jgi:pyruvate kinase
MNSKTVEILCTLGPSSMNERTIKRMTELGVTLFRLNLSHIPTDAIEESVHFVRQHTIVPVCLDTEGPQIRTGYVNEGMILLAEGAIIHLVREGVPGVDDCIHLRPGAAYNSLRVGDLVSIDFDSVLLSIAGVDQNGVSAHVICGGKVGSNKAVTVDRPIGLPILSEKDMVGIDVIRKLGLKQISLSFVNSKEDVLAVCKLLGPDVRLISKIETSEALRNLDAIIEVSDALLIDRGDLSREQPIGKIPLLQRVIIEHCNSKERPVLVATNLLESMVKTRKPLRSEVNDIMSTLLSGADGLVLAAETAIGGYPIECVAMVRRMIRYFEIAQSGYSLEKLLKNDSFLLIEPHGGFLVDRYNEHGDSEIPASLPRLIVDRTAIMDIEQIGIGTYSPLTGFMTKDELCAVLDNFSLPSGVVWTLPITLQVSAEQFSHLSIGMPVAIVFQEDNRIYATMEIRDRYTMNLDEMAGKCFQTTSRDHPGVSRLFAKGEYFVGGEILLIRRLPSPFKEYEYTPRQTRLIFEHREWSKVAGFHTRNAVHRAHEFLQCRALEKYHLDGVFLHPVIGPKKSDDFEGAVILESYRIVMEHYYPRGKFILGAFSAYSHYAGPREAVFTALCRKNFGCSHFILGRDHTGVKDFYSPSASVEIFDRIGEIGIVPIVFGTVHYCSACGQYVEACPHGGSARENISGTQVRELLRTGKRPPEWFLRDKVADMILGRIDNGDTVFVQ